MREKGHIYPKTDHQSQDLNEIYKNWFIHLFHHECFKIIEITEKLY